MTKTLTQVLVEEHRVILDVLDALPKEGVTDIALADDMLHFFREFADHVHHQKEEKILFPNAQKKGVLKEGGPIGMMLWEHEMGRELVQGMYAELTNLKAGQGKKFQKRLTDFRSLLKQHIQKEEECMFPTCDAVFSPQEQERIYKEGVQATPKKNYDALLELSKKIIAKCKKK